MGAWLIGHVTGPKGGGFLSTRFADNNIIAESAEIIIELEQKSSLNRVKNGGIRDGEGPEVGELIVIGLPEESP